MSGPHENEVLYFTDAIILGNGTTKEVTIYRWTKDSEVVYSQSEFEDYSISPQDEKNGIDPFGRLMVTYNDIFQNKFVVVFDFSREFGWKLVGFKKVDKRLDELVIRRE